MSTALIRGNMLTELANRGESAVKETDRLLREFLADKPGSWLPEDFFAPYELVERSMDAASPEGNHTLLRLLDQLVKEFFFILELETRKLDDSESRQLLGAMVIVGKHELLWLSRYPDVLEFAARQPKLFWHRVSAPTDIVSNRERFVKTLIERLPKKLLQRIQNPLPTHMNFLDDLSYLVGLASHQKMFKRAFLSGKMVEVAMMLNGVLHKTQLVRINDRFTVVMNEVELNQLFSQQSLPPLDLGEATPLEVASTRNISNAVLSRFHGSFDTSFARR